MENRLCVGVVTGAHGVLGMVRIKSFTEQPERIASLGELFEEGGQRRFRIEKTRLSGNVVLAQLAGVKTRNQAEALKGVRFMAPREALPKLDDPDDFYVSDLIGMRAETEEGELLGYVKGVADFGAGDVIEIAGESGSLLISFTRENVPLVAVAEGRIVVCPPRWIEGEEKETNVAG